MIESAGKCLHGVTYAAGKCLHGVPYIDIYRAELSAAYDQGREAGRAAGYDAGRRAHLARIEALQEGLRAGRAEAEEVLKEAKKKAFDDGCIFGSTSAQKNASTAIEELRAEIVRLKNLIALKQVELYKDVYREGYDYGFAKGHSAGLREGKKVATFNVTATVAADLKDVKIETVVRADEPEDERLEREVCERWTGKTYPMSAVRLVLDGVKVPPEKLVEPGAKIVERCANIQTSKTKADGWFFADQFWGFFVELDAVRPASKYPEDIPGISICRQLFGPHVVIVAPTYPTGRPCT